MSCELQGYSVFGSHRVLEDMSMVPVSMTSHASGSPMPLYRKTKVVLEQDPRSDKIVGKAVMTSWPLWFIPNDDHLFWRETEFGLSHLRSPSRNKSYLEASSKRPESIDD